MNKLFYGIYNVMTKINKEVNTNFRVYEDVREDFKVVAFIRGGSTSTLLRQYMIACIREEKKDAEYFEQKRLELQEIEEREKEAKAAKATQNDKIETKSGQPPIPLDKFNDDTSTNAPREFKIEQEESDDNGSQNNGDNETPSPDDEEGE